MFQIIQCAIQFISAGWQPVTLISIPSWKLWIISQMHNNFIQSINKHTMGVRSSNIEDHDLDNNPIYCIGFPEDIHFSSDDDSTNQYLIKLKSGSANKMFKCRVKSKKILNYFCLNAQLIVFIEPLFKKGNRFGIVTLSQDKGVRIHHIVSILKKQLKLEEKQALYIYENFKLLKDYQKLTGKNSRSYDGPHILNLKYSKLQILG